jgi:quinolinate synthase
VLIPDLRAGCSLASSITGADVRLIKQRHPGIPVVTYVNTTADVKAETDICCTSANAVQVVEWAAKRVGRRQGHPDPRRISGPQRRPPDRRQDHRLGRPLRGARALHRPGHRRHARGLAGRRILAHPECPAEILEAADFAGSTAAMNDYVAARKPKQVVLITECSMASNVQAESPLAPSSSAPATCART